MNLLCHQAEGGGLLSQPLPAAQVQARGGGGARSLQSGGFARTYSDNDVKKNGRM